MQSSVAMAKPRATAEVSASHEMATKDGHVSVGDVLSSITMFWVQDFENPQRSVAVQVRRSTPVPMHPLRSVVLSWYVTLTNGEDPQVVTAVAEPVTEGSGSTLHDIVMVEGQVIVTWAVATMIGRKASHTDKTYPRHLLAEWL